MTDLVADDTLFVRFPHPFGMELPYAPFPHPEREALLGPRLRNRMIFACQPIMRQIRRENRKSGGYLYKTRGAAAGYLALLRDPRARSFFLRISHITPDKLALLEKLGSDEDFARSMAVTLILHNLEKRFDDEFYKHLPRLHHEDRKVGWLATWDEDDADRLAVTVLDRLEAIIDAFVDDAVRYTGRCLERDFKAADGRGGWRAPRLVAEFVNLTFGRPKLTEDQVRYACGWIAAKP